MDQPLVGIILGSTSDEEAMRPCAATLAELGVCAEQIVASAHRAPQRVAEWAGSAEERGLEVLIAAAGKAAALPGVVASHTALPVIGVPMKTSDLGGLDSLLSIVQMPPGVPVACVAIGGAKNAALLATQIVGAAHPEVKAAFAALKQEMAQAR